MPFSSEPRIYTVSSLNSTVRIMLEQEMGMVWLNAELSNLVQHSSGHWYFTLKDPRAQIKAAMFKGSNRRVTFKPQNGQQVLVQGQLSLYEARGDYQLIVERMQPAGEGLLQLRYAALKDQLSQEGLFNPDRKRPLPEVIQTVGVITSPTGAAIHDILSVLGRRDPSLRIILYPSSVQGESAAPALMQAMQTAWRRDECDVLIVGRGGGSLEDLWCFNDERVVRAIAQSPIPVISAVGHEIDVTLADFAADLRAPTPSAAAELVSGDRQAMLRTWHTLWQRHLQVMSHQLQSQTLRWQRLQTRLQQQNPLLHLRQNMQRADELTYRLHQAVQRMMQRHQLRLQTGYQWLLQQSPQYLLERQQHQHGYLTERLQNAMIRLQQRKQQRWQELGKQLHLLSPLQILARGYSVTLDHQNHPVVLASQVQQGDTLRIRLHQGQLDVQATQIFPDD